MTSTAEQVKVLIDGAEELIPPGELERRIDAVVQGTRPPLRVKFGMDPTSPDVHLGHTVVLRKLAQFQRFGHTAVLIIGGFTAQVGDPSGRSSARPRLSPEEVAANAATYLAQVRRVLDGDRLEVVDNRDWLANLGMSEVLSLTSRATVAQMLERADFAARYRSGRPIAVSELLYPLLQGQDSVEVRADVELGGTDQTFNLLVGRDLQVAAGPDPQVVLTMPLIEGLDGAAKMSKTSGNTIGVTEAPEEMFGKAMRVRDELMVKYFRLVTDVHPDEVAAIEAGLAAGTSHPGDTKRRLARELVTLYHDADAAQAAEARFNAQFRDRAVPEDAPRFDLGSASTWQLPRLLVAAGLAASGSEARRLVNGHAVRLDGVLLDDPLAVLTTEELDGKSLQVGKRRFARLHHG